MSSRIVIAPDAFKGTHDARRVADALAAGVAAAGGEPLAIPIADGGEGTMDALVERLGGELREEPVEDPLGRPVRAQWAWLDDDADDGPTAIVETAQASGYALVAEGERDAYAASTRGTGQLVVAAARAGARHVLVPVGGSATSDGGSGAVEAIREAAVDVPRITVICDVTTPFEDAARVYGPQKGADEETVERLGRRLQRLADEAPRDPRGVPMTGGAGGLSGGLWAWFGAELVPGAPYVLDAVRFDDALRDARLVITGEGGLDEQTFAGKAVGEVAARAGRHGVPCHAVVGRTALAPDRAAQLGLASVTAASTLDEIARAARALLAG
ncbi:glycerate kinase family protein [Patulibacter sp. S7RM1-6]